MATKTKTKTAAPKTQIPAAVRPGGSSAKDLLAKLVGGKTIVKAPAVKGRPTLELTDEALEVFKAYCPAKVLFDHFESYVNNLKEELKTHAFGSWVKSLWKQKSQPTNPSIKAVNDQGKPDFEAMYIVQNKFKVQAQDEAQAVTNLRDLGLDPNDAQRLVDSELDFTPTTGLRPFNELTDGRKEGEAWVEATAAEQAVATKVLQFVMTLDDAERDLIVKSVPKIRVKDGFFERVTGYVKSEEQLASVFQVVQPVGYPKGAKFAVSDPLEVQNARKIEAAAVILGTQLGVE